MLFVGLFTMMNVGADIIRPHKKSFEFALVSGEFQTLCRRAIDNRPYNFYATLSDKLKLAVQLRYRAGLGSYDTHCTGHELSAATRRQTEI